MCVDKKNICVFLALQYIKHTHAVHMSRFEFSSMQIAVLIGDLCQQEEDVRSQIAELGIVQQILDTPAWTAQDLLVDAQHRRLVNCYHEVRRHELLGRDGLTGSYGFGGHVNGFQESPFWMCVREAKDQVMVLLQKHANKVVFGEGDQGALLANTGGYVFKPFPGGDGQVQVAFHLVTLLYATFTIPLPLSAGNLPTETHLWHAMITHDRSHMYRDNNPTQSMPTLRCLDTSPRFFHDVHNLKRNLRHDIFSINNITDSVRVSEMFPLPAEPVMPWLDILRELVGYTKYVQAQADAVAHQRPAFYALAELRHQCEVEMAKARQRLADLMDQRHEATVTFLKEGEVQEHSTAGRPHTDSDSLLPRLLSRMQAVLNT